VNISVTDSVQSGRNLRTFRQNDLPPSSSVNVSGCHQICTRVVTLKYQISDTLAGQKLSDLDTVITFSKNSGKYMYHILSYSHITIKSDDSSKQHQTSELCNGETMFSVR
jgi:hypothetical protein